MVDFFYLILFFLSQANFFLLFNFVKIYKIKDWFRGFYTVTKKLPDISNFREPQEFFLLGFWTFINTLNFIFLTVGLLSSQWKFFLITLSVLILFTFLEKKTKNQSLMNLVVDLSRTLLVVLSQVFFVLNHFHWHFNL